MGKIVKIYCEGKAGSFDYEILDKIVQTIGSNILIQPIGGKRGAKSAIQVYEKLAVKSDFKLFFRDRDFDQPVPNQPSLIQDGYIYFSYRTTIENYLFRTDLFHQFLQKNQLTEQYKITSIAAVEQLFTQAAESIKFYQAARHALGKMRQPTDFGTSWIGKSGVLPAETDLSRENCSRLAFEKINHSKTIANQWEQRQFEQIYQQFIELFDEEFMETQQYLVWYQGKDFASALKRILPNFPMKSYYKFALQHFDYRQFADLVELKALIQSVHI